MKVKFWLGVFLAFVCWSASQSSTLLMNVVEMKSTENVTLVCNVSLATNLTRWTYLSGSTGTSLMRFQNGTCTVSPLDSFLSDSRYSYTCNSTVYQVTIHNIQGFDNNNILTCRDALQLDGTGSIWMIKTLQANETCRYCEPTITIDVLEVTEEENITFTCRVSSNVTLINWNVNLGSNTAPMSVQNGTCLTSSNTTFLDNKKEYNYTCNNTVYQVTRLNVTRSQHNDMYMCTPQSQEEGNGSNWIIKVKAPVISVKMTPTDYMVNNVENTVVEFTCTTSTARPAASVYWYRHPNGKVNNTTQITENVTEITDYNDLSITTSTIRIVPTRQENDTKIYCAANNTVNATLVKPNAKKLLNVLYKADDPYITQGDEYHVIENTIATLSCSVKGGNPTPALTWNFTNFTPTNLSTITSNGNTTMTLTWNVSITHNGTCTCTSQQTVFHVENIDVALIVLYPPSKPVFKENDTIVDEDIAIIEGNSTRIECTTDSQPAPDSYTWTGPAIIDKITIHTLNMHTVKKEDAGQYNCSVLNTMNQSIGEPVAGINNNVVNVVVLYAPLVAEMKNTSQLIETELNMSCQYTTGMPIETSIRWTRNIDTREWIDEPLYISSIKRNDSGYYFCNASNVMTQTGDNKSYIGHDTQSFYLDVLYEASVTSFTIDGFTSHNVTVNESESVSFMCHVDSNPAAVTTLRNDSNILKINTSNIVEHNITQARCLDAGTYVCSARNEYNGENDSVNTLLLFVNCYPRTAEEVDMNITSETNAPITLTLNFIAYPRPTVKWYQLVNDSWTLLENDNNYTIQSSTVQSNLTIQSVGIDDFTSYKVIVENELGEMEQFYIISKNDKPDSPTQFTHIEDRTTLSSIHIQWKPGFDGGLAQTFYIRYKRSSDIVWNYLNVSDNGEETMELSFTGLTENTQYKFVILASNEKGNSSDSSVLIASTKAIARPSLIPLIGGITGGVTGCIILVIVIIVLIRRYPLPKGTGANEAEIRRSVSDDSDEGDELIDNPMYESADNMASAASTSSEVSSQQIKPNMPSMIDNGDYYAVVKKNQDSKGHSKNGSGMDRLRDGDEYESVEVNNVHNTAGVGIELSIVKATPKESELKSLNKDGLMYSDIVFNDKQPGEKIVIIGDDPTQYDLVDFSKKAEHLPDSIYENAK
ncbi:Nephrosis 1 [Mactra antiquata]